MAVDLDALKKLLAEAYPERWTQGKRGVLVDLSLTVFYGDNPVAECWNVGNTALIVALHNSASDLVRELEAARAVVEIVRKHIKPRIVQDELFWALAAYDTAVKP